MTTSTVARGDVLLRRSHQLDSPSDGSSQAVLDLSAMPAAPGCARAWTRRILREWQLTFLSDSAELVVSELSTNAIHASPPLDHAVIRLTLTLTQGELGIFVRDYCPGTPQQADVRDEDENGRGLLIVEAMSSASGWYRPEDGAPGKVVWATLSS